MNKRLFKMVLVLTCIVVCLFALTACNTKHVVTYNFKEVSTFEEFKSTTGAIRLTADIDCDFAVLQSKSCSAFDGNGHTIKNMVLSGNSLFTGEPAYIKNVTFENITYTSNGVTDAGMLLTYSDTPVYATTFENVTVKNSTVTAKSSTNVGVFMGRSFEKRGVFYSNKSQIDDSRDKTTRILNCAMDNVAIEVEGKGSKTVYVGGFIGSAENTKIEGSELNATEITFTSNDVGSEPCVGGVTGYLSGALTKCGVTDSTIKARAYGYQSTALGLTLKTTDATVGGLVGNLAGDGISHSFFSNGTVLCHCSGTADVGGCAGYTNSTITQSYVSDSDIEVVLDRYGKLNPNVGGFIGAANGCTVTSSYVASTWVALSDLYSYDEDELYGYGKVAGFIAAPDNSSLAYCATNNVFEGNYDPDVITNHSYDDFSLGGALSNCFITNPHSTLAGNSNGLGTIDEEVWLNGEIKTRLNLTGSAWVFEENKLPYLDIHN